MREERKSMIMWSGKKNIFDMKMMENSSIMKVDMIWRGNLTPAFSFILFIYKIHGTFISIVDNVNIRSSFIGSLGPLNKADRHKSRALTIAYCDTCLL